MRAATHTEIYRPFKGKLSAHPFRAWPLVASGVRVATKKKLPLLLLYGFSGMATVIFSFVVYARYAVEQAMAPAALGGSEGLTSIIAAQAMKNLAVRNMVAEFCVQTAFFALLATAWYGSGLFAEDRRVGAHQLYFSRPLTRLDYFLGKFLTVAFFAALTMLVPGLVICLVASFASEDWSFLTEHGDLILRVFANAALWILLTGSITLAISSLVKRKAFALAGTFGLFMILGALGGLLGELRNDRLGAIGPMMSYQTVSHWVFGLEMGRNGGIELQDAGIALASFIVLALATIAWRLKKLEVVA